MFVEGLSGVLIDGDVCDQDWPDECLTSGSPAL